MISRTPTGSAVSLLAVLLLTIFLAAVAPGTTSLAITDEERAMRQFRFAFGLFKEGDVNEAVNQFEKLISFHKRFSKIDLGYFLLGESYFRKGEYEKALEVYGQVTRHHVDSEVAPDARMAVGWCLFRLGRYPEARVALETVLKTDEGGKTISEANFLLGETFLHARDYAAALPYFAEVREKYSESPNHGEAVFKEALCMLKTGKYAEAVAGFGGFVEKSVNSPLFEDALYNLAEASYLSGSYDIAIAYYEKLLKIGRTDRFREPSLYSMAFARFKKGDFAKAREEFLKLTNSSSREMAAEAALRAAKCLYSLGKYDEASADLEKVSKEFKDSRFAAEASLVRGMSMYKTGKYKEAAAAFEKTAADFSGTPEGISALQLQGTAYFSGEKYDAAIAVFRTFREKTDDRKKAMEASLRIADSLFNLKKYKESTGEYLLIIENYKDLASHDQIYFSVGETWYLMGNMAKAFEYYRLSAEVPNSRFRSDGLYRAAVAAERSGKNDKALEMYIAVANEFKGKNLEDQARLKAAGLLMNRRKYSEALEHLERIIRNEGSKQVGDALLMKGNSLKMAGRYPEAEAAYRALITGHSDAGELFDSGRQGLAYSLYMQKKYVDAVEEYRYVVDHYPDSSLVAEAQYWIGKCFFMKGDYRNAVVEYLKVTILYPDSSNAPYAFFKIGECKSKLGQPAESMKNYEKLVERYPSSDLVNLARENISRIKESLKATLTGREGGQEFPLLPDLDEASSEAGSDPGQVSKVKGPEIGGLLRPAPAKVEPAKVEPAKVEPSKVEPSKVEPSKVDPSKKVPETAPPVKAESAAKESVKGDSVSFEDLGKALMRDIENLIDKQDRVKGPEEE